MGMGSDEEEEEEEDDGINGAFALTDEFKWFLKFNHHKKNFGNRDPAEGNRWCLGTAGGCPLCVSRWQSLVKEIEGWGGVKEQLRGWVIICQKRTKSAIANGAKKSMTADMYIRHPNILSSEREGCQPGSVRSFKELGRVLELLTQTL